MKIEVSHTIFDLIKQPAKTIKIENLFQILFQPIVPFSYCQHQLHCHSLPTNFKARVGASQLVEIDSGEELLFSHSKIPMFSKHLFFTLKNLINTRKKNFNKNGFAELI